MYTVANICFWAEGYYSGASYEENILIPINLCEKIREELEKMNIYVFDLDGKHSEVKGIIDFQFFTDEDIIDNWESSETINDGTLLLERLQEICNKHNIDLDEEMVVAKQYVDKLLEKDFYLSEKNCYQRLVNEYKKYGKLIFAVDFDDTIYDFHKLGRKYDKVIDLLQRWENHSEVIIFTGNGKEKYPMIEQYLKEHNIKYDGINCDSSVIVSGAKIYANVYIDDRGGLPLVYQMLKRLICEIEDGVVTYE